jgi:DNA-directed RNA polymerase subunit RPC12/RpoP
MPESMSYPCPACGIRLKLTDPALIGKKIRCPKCSNVFLVPQPGAAPPPTAPPAPAAPPPPAPARSPAPAAIREEPPEEDLPVVPPRPAGREEADEDEDRPAEKPRRRKEKPAAPARRTILVPVLAVVVIILYLGLAVMYHFNAYGDEPPQPLRMPPRTTLGSQ